MPMMGQLLSLGGAVSFSIGVSQMVGHLPCRLPGVLDKTQILVG